MNHRAWCGFLLPDTVILTTFKTVKIAFKRVSGAITLTLEIQLGKAQLWLTHLITPRIQCGWLSGVKDKSRLIV